MLDKNIAPPGAKLQGTEKQKILVCAKKKCGGTFVTDRPDKKYCSTYCQMTRHPTKYKRKPVSVVICMREQCKKEFLQKKAGQKYCSSYCQLTYNKLRICRRRRAAGKKN